MIELGFKHYWRLLLAGAILAGTGQARGAEGALGYQESQLDQSKRSPAGAIGVMQMKPSTAADKNVGITGIEELENNIHAGIRHLRFLRDRYFSDPEVDALNQTLFTFASYNAGPARIAKLRKRTAEMGLDRMCGSAMSSTR